MNATTTSRRKTGAHRAKWARCVAALRDGPLTVPGAAEMLGMSESVIRDYFKAMHVVGVAAVITERKNTHGKPTPVWGFVEVAAA